MTFPQLRRISRGNGFECAKDAKGVITVYDPANGGAVVSNGKDALEVYKAFGLYRLRLAAQKKSK